MYWYDYYYYYLILVLPAVIFALWAQIRVKSAYAKYSKISTRDGRTGAEIARALLDSQGLYSTEVRLVSGNLTDNFDPRSNCVSLSEGVYNSSSVAASGIAAHECGHAMQHSDEYAPARFRSAIVPVTNIGSSLSMPLIILSLFTGLDFLFVAGILLFSLSTVFQLVTLPVEFNASHRAMSGLEAVMADNELAGARKVLSAAALTYVAALAVSLMSLLRLILMSRNRR